MNMNVEFEDRECTSRYSFLIRAARISLLGVYYLLGKPKLLTCENGENTCFLWLLQDQIIPVR